VGTEKMKSAIKWIGSLVACVALIYFGLKFKDQMSEAMPLILDWKNLVWWILGSLAVAPQMACAALAWQCILSGLGARINSLSAIRIVFLSQFARYIPGNVGHHMGKLVLAKSEGIAVKQGALSILVETVMVLLIGLSISAISLPEQLFGYLAERNWTWVFLPAVVLLVVCLVWVAMKGFDASAIRRFRTELLQDWRGKVGLLLQVVIYYTINFLFIGGLAWLLATQVFGAHELSLLQLTSIMAFCWTVGFLAPGAPAGLGVREVIALALLANSYEPDVATGIVLLHRLVLTTGDLLTFLIGLAMAASNRKLTTE